MLPVCKKHTLFTHWLLQVWKKQFDDEIEKGRVLQEALHALALEHHELEKSYSRSSIARSYVTDDDEFYDCEEDDLEALTCVYESLRKKNVCFFVGGIHTQIC